MKANNKVLSLFFVTIFLSTVNEYFTYVYIGTLLGKVISLVDEAFVIWLLIHTLSTKSIHLNSTVKIGVVGFCLCGLLSNFLHGTSAWVSVLGLFNTLKPVIIFICFIQYTFSWNNFKLLMRKFEFFFPVIAIGFFIDALTPAFHQILGIGVPYFRAGIRVLSGIFVKETNCTLWALIFYIYYRFYRPNEKKSKAKYVLAMIMTLFTFKVKDILGIVACYTFTMLKRVNLVYIFVGVPIVALSFFIYVTFMPEHYTEYFKSDRDNSNVARVVLNYTSTAIAKDNIPLGVGFGQFASPVSRDYDSSVYKKYGIDHVYGLTNEKGEANYMCDTFWPMILGETGILGVLFYMLILYEAFGKNLFKFFQDTHNLNYLFPSLLFIVFLIVSIGKPVFSGPPHSFVVWGFAGLFYSFKNSTYEASRFSK